MKIVSKEKESPRPAALTEEEQPLQIFPWKF